MVPNAAQSRGRWPLIILGLIIAWLWLWTLFAYYYDLPRQVLLQQRLGIPSGTLSLLAEVQLWAMAAALVIALASWRVRRLRVIGMVCLILVPAFLLMGLYPRMGLSPSHVQHISAALQASAER